MFVDRGGWYCTPLREVDNRRAAGAITSRPAEGRKVAGCLLFVLVKVHLARLCTSDSTSFIPPWLVSATKKSLPAAGLIFYLIAYRFGKVLQHARPHLRLQGVHVALDDAHVFAQLLGDLSIAQASYVVHVVQGLFALG